MANPPSRSNPLAASAARVRIFLILVAILFSFAGMRSVQLQVLDSRAYADEASDKMRRSRTILPVRGEIADRSGTVLAFTEATVNVVADPASISTNGRERQSMRERDHLRAEQAPQAIADIVVRHAGGDADELVQRLSNHESRYAVLAKQVSASTWLAINSELSAGEWIGVYSESNPKRNYPLETVGSNMVGFMIDGKGMGGIEYAKEDQLVGTPGKESYDISPNGRIPLSNQVLEPATNGSSVSLTIDSDFQWMVEKILSKQVKATHGKWGTAVVLSAKTGEVLAMANYPTFDSNALGKAKSEALGNQAIGATYEPGSVQKVLVLASLLDAGLITPDTEVPIGPKIQVGDHFVSDAFKHDDITLTARGIIARSSNVGAITVARKMEKEHLLEYMSNFGLGAKPGTGLPGESAGKLPKANMPDYQRDSMAFGYGLSVSPVQMAAAVAALANGGVYNQPTVISSVTSPDGTVTTPDRDTRRVVSEQAAADIMGMMQQMVIYNGPRLMIDGYNSGAKTGTSRTASGGGYNGQVTSIVGVAPIEDPQIVVLVAIARPDQSGSGIGQAGPVYKDIMKLALPRYGVLPSKKVDTKQLRLEK